MFFFFKQKTAYEMRISDWSSDVCSSDLRTIADSLAPPYALPYSYGLCRRFVDEIVLIDDDAMRRAMGLLFREMKLAVEPAGAAATAALTGPLRSGGRRGGKGCVSPCRSRW